MAKASCSNSVEPIAFPLTFSSSLCSSFRFRASTVRANSINRTAMICAGESPLFFLSIALLSVSALRIPASSAAVHLVGGSLAIARVSYLVSIRPVALINRRSATRKINKDCATASSTSCSKEGVGNFFSEDAPGRGTAATSSFASVELIILGDEYSTAKSVSATASLFSLYAKM